VLVSSAIADVEVRRAARRVGAEAEAVEVLRAVRKIAAGEDVVETAAKLDPPELRTLDAMHVASALEVADLIECIVAYDARLIAAGRGAGLEVASPG
jgi:predicted nucleic acid-binding protein